MQLGARRAPPCGRVCGLRGAGSHPTSQRPAGMGRDRSCHRRSVFIGGDWMHLRIDPPPPTLVGSRAGAWGWGYTAYRAACCFPSSTPLTMKLLDRGGSAATGRGAAWARRPRTVRCGRWPAAWSAGDVLVIVTAWLDGAATGSGDRVQRRPCYGIVGQGKDNLERHRVGVGKPAMTAATFVLSASSSMRVSRFGGAVLPPLPALRTVRVRFRRHGSSLSNAWFGRRFRHG